MRFVDRTWKQFWRADVANNAEHSFRVAWLALYIARKEGAHEEQVLKMALLHDLSETRTGDTNYVTRMYTDRDDDAAYHDVLSGTVFESDLGDVARAYKARETLEAKIVKDADNLDVDLEIQEQITNGNSLGSRWIEGRRAGVYPKLFTATARQLFDEIYNADPSNWHRTTKNRLTSGDFKSPEAG